MRLTTLMMLLMVVIELIGIAIMVNDPYEWYPNENHMSDIKSKVANGELTPLEGNAEAIMYFAMFWIVAAVGKFWLQFRSATISAAFSVPLFTYGYILKSDGYSSALLTGGVTLVIFGGIMLNFHQNCWHKVGEDLD